MNYRRLVLMVAFLGLAPVGAIAGEYEYYRGAQFPGKGLREDVELRTVVSEGGEPTEYQRREVKFFPRKGVDKIPAVAGMIKRDWTLTDLGKSFTPKVPSRQPKAVRWVNYSFNRAGL